ncbi:MAG: hypothetical protein ACOC22_00470 [bacterium]
MKGRRKERCLSCGKRKKNIDELGLCRDCKNDPNSYEYDYVMLGGEEYESMY